MDNSQRYKMRPLTWVLLSFLLVLVSAVILPRLLSVRQEFVEAGIIVFAMVVLIIGMVQIRRLNRRLAALADVAEHVGRGNYLVRSPDAGHDAIGALAQSVNGMIEKIQQSVERLEQQQTELEVNRKMLEGQNEQLTGEYERQASFGKFLSSLNTVDINTISDKGLAYLMDLSSAFLGQIYLTNDRGELSVVAEKGIDRSALDQLQGDANTGLPMEVMQRREWIVLNHLSGASLPRINLGLTRTDIMTLVAMPVLFQGRSLGVVLLGVMHDVEPATKLILQSSLDAMGASLNNAMTYKTVQKQAFKLEQANQELLEADRLRSEFVANMSHELRTPLNSVIGFSTVLMKNRNQSLIAQDLNYVEKINRNGKHLLGLINDILDLSKIEAGRMDVEMRPTRLQDVVRETGEMLHSQADAKHISLDISVDDDVPLTETDSAKLKQVLINLMGNAIKFTEQGGVTLSLSMGQRGPVVAIEDTGIGIPADKINTIFEPFRQADAGTTRKYGGTGLGLAISRSMVDMLGGQLTVRSEEGKGSVFSIELPTVPAEKDSDVSAQVPDTVQVIESQPQHTTQERMAAVAEAVSSSSGLDQHKILVVDDDPDARDLLSSYMEEIGAIVIQAQDGEHALALAREHKPDLITLDLMMPGIDGWEVLRRLKQDVELKDIPVVIVSIIAEKRKALVLGAMDAITKPVVQDELLGIMQRCLDSYRNAKILVVDDNQEIWELFDNLLEGQVGEIRHAENGRVALEVLESYRPDLIFLDLMMPEMDGLTFLRVLRTDKRLLSLPVAVVTAKKLSETERRELEMRVVDIVEKGEEMMEGRLMQVLEEAIKK